LVFALSAEILSFAVAPVASTWKLAGKPTPPTPLNQIALGMASAFVTLGLVFGIGLLVVLAIRLLHR